MRWVSFKELRAAYEEWAHERGERNLLAGNAFTAASAAPGAACEESLRSAGASVNNEYS
ncbi:MAG: hypothetical protein H0V18_12270 [Pyrinomonadaceae bacterium]|nr:hypothetical protein [Pyrinomonadaceae bacterium]